MKFKCPYCKKVLEENEGYPDFTDMNYKCKNCRIYWYIYGLNY